MASIRELKQRIDLHDLAEKLGLERPGGTGNYKSPHHADKNPSISIFDAGKAWKDFSSENGGDCISLVRFVEEIDNVPDAMRRLHELYSIPFDKPDNTQPRPERSREEYLADQCKVQAQLAVPYLVKRGVKQETVEWALKRGAVGFNTWTSNSIAEGVVGHGGPAVAFVCRDYANMQVQAVDFRYLDPSLNGGVKTKSLGQKDGQPWFVDRQHVQRARRVYIFESAINALVTESCGLKMSAAIALRGTGNASNIDWRFLVGKQVVICMDADEPDDKGVRPGAKAAWALYDALTALNIGAIMVDQKEWYELGYNDAADIAERAGLDQLRTMLETHEPWVIPGLAGRDGPKGIQRVYLPGHDFAVYWRFRAKLDFTSFVSKLEKNEDGGEDLPVIDDLAGFRVASLSRVTIQSATATMSGEEDAQPNTVFAVSVQTARHGAQLMRRVLNDERLYNIDYWKKFGPVFNPNRFARMITVLERSAECGARDALNFVGLAWRQGKPVVNEGPDCYFTEPEKQCPYSALSFPSGQARDARRVIEAYQATFRENAAAQLLTWSLGGHLKAFLGFWPHMIVQADKGSGKSTLIKRLERSIGMTMFGGQSLQTEFRLLTSACHTSHPVGWEEISARRQDVINVAVAMLQESYQFTLTRRGSDLTEFLISAPVLLAGEDVPVRSLTGKVIRADLTGRKGPLMPEGIPRFPVRQWLQFLASLTREQVQSRLAEWEQWCWDGCRARPGDTGASRMVRNYGSIALAWALLCEFAGMARETGDFLRDLRAEMNKHIAETSGDREPWVWILETAFSEIESHQFLHPYAFDVLDSGEEVIILRPQHVMDHISTTNRLRDMWNGLPVKSGRIFKRQLDHAGVIEKDELDRRIGHRRHAHLTALSLRKLAEYGLYISQPDEPTGTQMPEWARAANE
ncbi:MAG: hypothetical protein BGP10_12330 [Rhodanobacter sp. 68-29]|nr:toprim domain-containing protein [Rhodanobacter sp.]ODV27974.1 MAG: hypothetical protein ABT19_00250 [Rhodanobacter sp. SCN 68-63]OJY60678.1 MAG: hypothetical protein BGP10_12330 [Rhodanobacter sp. 68-29]